MRGLLTYNVSEKGLPSGKTNREISALKTIAFKQHPGKDAHSVQHYLASRPRSACPVSSVSREAVCSRPQAIEDYGRLPAYFSGTIAHDVICTGTVVVGGEKGGGQQRR